MMKRTGVPRMGPDEASPLAPQNSAQIQQAGASNMHTLAQSAQPQILDIRSGAGTTAMLSVGGGFRASRPAGAPVINYLKPAAVQYAAKQPPPQVPQRIKTLGGPGGSLGALPAALGRQSPAPAPAALAPAPPSSSAAAASAPPQPQAPGQFQRLKVEDALSYLDQVKYKFNTQPQVYNDFLDIMKEFKSQTIDTPGVITRVSNLFKGHPELIVGFNTFLPPGYKIEVQSNGQVSVSMPSPTGFGGSGSNVVLGVQQHQPPPQQQLVHLLPVAQETEKEAVRRGGGYSNMEMSVNNAIVHNLSVNAAPTNTLHQISQAHQQIEAAAIHHGSGPGSAQPSNQTHAAPAPPSQPVEFNHAIEYVNKIKSRFSRQPDKYKRFLEILHAYQRGHREMKEPQAKQQTEQEVYSQVAKLFENQDDLLAEFGQFLPDAKAVTKPPPECRERERDRDRERHYPHVRSPPMPLHHQYACEQAPRVEPEVERFPPVPPASPPHHHHHAPQPPKHSSAAPSVAPVPPPQHHHLKRSPSFTSSSQMAVGGPPNKKCRVSGLTSGGLPGAGLAGGGASGGPGAGAGPGAGGLAGAALPALALGGAARDVSYAEAAKLATIHEFNFFDRARKALRSQHVYDNFLRCLLLFTNEIISSSELLCVTAPFLCRHPELQKWLQDFLGPPSPPHTPNNTMHTGFNNSAFGSGGGGVGGGGGGGGGGGCGTGAGGVFPTRYEPVGALGAQLRHERPQGDAAMDVDLTTCKRLGTSYCALPREAAARRCSGRTPLCKEVLNDTWVSFPTWSEDSTFVTSRKTQYEEYIYRCEDERFELDVVIETNASTIRVLEGVQKKLSRMTPEDAAKYRLDDCLGGHSPTIHQRALRRIYGDKAVDIIAGLKKNPVVAVPVVLRRLKAKEDEWREAQKGFNKQWREQNEKYYLKSLDHQGINFKQNDLKAMRSKSLFNEVESAFAARLPGPHVVVDYNMSSRQEAIKILRDTAELLIHHARRQTAIQKAEKRRIKQLLRHFLPDLFSHPRQPLSDDERDEEEKDEGGSPGSPSCEAQDDKNTNTVKQEKQESSESDAASDKSGKNNKNKENKPKNNNNTDSKDSSNTSANSVKRTSSNEEMSMKTEIKAEPQDLEDDYRDHPPNEARFVCTSSWYLFLRVHGALCQRLGAARRAAAALGLAHDSERPPRPPVAHALRLKPNNLPHHSAEPAHYYDMLLELVRSVLDGNMDTNTYEDAAREMLGIKAYPAYTLDKLVSIAVRQLQHCAAEPWSVRAADLARAGMRGPLAYVRRAARYLRRDHSVVLAKLYGGDDCRVTFELLAAQGEAAGRASPHEPDTARLAAWPLYRDRDRDRDRDRYPPPPAKPVFLLRNARARAGGYTHNAHSLPGGATPCRLGHAGHGGHAGHAGHAGHPHSRRKPPRLHDAPECRLLAFRPLQLYQRGALPAARASHARLHAKRRERFRAWLRTRTP